MRTGYIYISYREPTCSIIAPLFAFPLVISFAFKGGAGRRSQVAGSTRRKHSWWLYPGETSNQIMDHSADGGGEREGRRLYNPYGDLHGAIDYRPIQNIYQIPTAPEFLFQEEAAVQRRSWGENITYYTGCGYLLGAVSGASVGLVEGLKAREPGDSMKLRVNRVLNASGHTGMKFGNRLGVIGLLYAGLESGIVAARGTDDIFNSVCAGLGTGALYKAAAGPRSAAVAGAIGGLAVGALVAGKQALKRYVPI